jgi:hypothetical protein
MPTEQSPPTAITRSSHEPRHLAIRAAWIIQIRNAASFGAFQGWPQEHIPPGVKWSQRVEAAGARVPPSRHGRSADLVVVLRLTGRKGAARNIDVFYRESGQQYHFRYNTAIGLTQAPACNFNVPAPPQA